MSGAIGQTHTDNSKLRHSHLVVWYVSLEGEVISHDFRHQRLQEGRFHFFLFSQCIGERNSITQRYNSKQLDGVSTESISYPYYTQHELA